MTGDVPVQLPEGVVRGARTPSGTSGAPRTREGPVAVVGADVEEDVRRALAFILRSTGAKPQTEAELRAKLRAREVPDATIDGAITIARTMRALDDEAFAASWVAERGLGRGYGRARLRRELAKRQVPDHLAEQALEQLEERDDVSAAAELARARLRQLPTALATEAVARRLTAYLVRRGHPPGLAQRVAKDVSGLNREWD